MSERSAVRYRARGIVMAGKGPGMAQRDRTFPPQPREDLVFRGGRTLPQMSYKTFYVGSGWADGAPASSRANLDAALAAAMTDPALDEIVGQFFGGSNITTLPLPSTVLDLPLQQVFDKGDIHALAERTFMSGVLSAVDLDTCVVNFVLPPGAILSSEGGGEAHLRVGRRAPLGTPDIEEEDSRNGLGGYHGSIHIMHPGRRSPSIIRSRYGPRETTALRSRAGSHGRTLARHSTMN